MLFPWSAVVGQDALKHALMLCAIDRAIGGASVSYVFSNWQAGLNLDASRGQNSMTEAATISLSSRF